ncbi:MAG: DUF6442 family protein [Clostridia bacterium]|nr:DUF6442 family protein [Clostridia bacterium]
MDKEDILRKSRKENDGMPDERELAEYGNAARVGMRVGGWLCLALTIVGSFVFKNYVLASVGWFVYFVMMGSNHAALYARLKNRKDLAYAVGELLIAAAYAVALVGYELIKL